MIGTWNDSGCIMAFLPKVWENGDAPDMINGPSLPGSIPVYVPGSGTFTGGEILVIDSGSGYYKDGEVHVFYGNTTNTGAGFNTGYIPASGQWTKTMTVACWYRYNLLPFSPGYNLTQNLIAMSSGGTTGDWYSWYLKLQPAGRLSVALSQTIAVAPIPILTEATKLLQNNDPHFVAFTYDEGTVRVYVDGEEWTSIMDVINVAPTTLVTPNQPITLGGQYRYADQPPSGYYALYSRTTGEIKGSIIYDRVLSSGEVTDLYNIGPSLDGLYGYRTSDGNMIISETEDTSHLIGNFDNRDVMFAILPACLKNGTNPDSFNTGTFPVYQGPKATVEATSEFVNYSAGYGYDSSTGHIKIEGAAGTTFKAESTDLSVDDTKQRTALLMVKVPDGGSIYDTLTCMYGDNYSGIVQYRQLSGTTVDRVQSDYYNDVRGYATIGATNNIPLDAFADHDNVYGLFLEMDSYVYPGLPGMSGVLSSPWVTMGSATLGSDSHTPNTDVVIENCSGIGFGNTYDLNPAIGTLQPSDYELAGFVLFDKVLSDSEMSAIGALGSDLGGLYGYIEEDGSLILTSEARPTPGCPRRHKRRLFNKRTQPDSSRTFYVINKRNYTEKSRKFDRHNPYRGRPHGR